MISITAIFQPEITTLEAQVTQLQAQIAQAKQRITHLNEAESITDSAIQSLETALQKISALAPSALANLKSAVLNLFSGDSDSDVDNQSITPTEPESPLNGQACEFDSLHHSYTASPDGSAWDLASLEACQTEDAPTQADEKPFIELVQLSDALAYQRKHDGEIVCVYAGFNNKTKAKLWGEWLAVHHSVASGFEVRLALRLTNFRYELKLWAMSLQQIERLASNDLTKSPPSNYDDQVSLVSKKVSEEEALASIQPGGSWNYSANPIGAKGAAANWKAFQSSGRKLDLKPGFDPMQKWRDLEAEQKQFALSASNDDAEF